MRCQRGSSAIPIMLYAGHAVAQNGQLSLRLLRFGADARHLRGSNAKPRSVGQYRAGPFRLMRSGDVIPARISPEPG